MLRNKLYTVNKWNRSAFIPKKNLFLGGGGLWNGGNSGFVPFDSDAAAKDVELIRGNQFNPSQANTSFSGGLSLNQQIARDGYNPGTMKQQIDSLTTPSNNSGSTKSISIKPTTMQAIGMASNFMDKISTGDKRGMWDTLDPVYHLAGGRESAAGNVMSDAGVALTKSGLQSGQPYMALAGAALKVVGGLTNAAFGIKENKQLKEIADTSINTNSNFKSNATSFDAIKGPSSMTNTNVYEGGWFSGGKASDKNDALAKNMATAYSWADRSVLNNVRNLTSDLNSDFLRNYSAYGGPLDYVDPSTPIGYSIYTDRYRDKLKNNLNMTNMFAGTPDIFGFGGGIYTKGANFDTGVSFINKGGSHEENPYEGVQMGVDSQGVPNLVEEGEVKWGDYMFSDRLIVPRGKRGNYGKRARKYAEGGKLAKGKGIDTPYESKVLKPYEGLTFADAAKKILKRNGADERDDAITMRGIDAELSVLAGIQEKEREKEKLREMLETIDNMSPEEFAMLLQQMEAQLAALQQQEMAMQLQLMIPLGMELMQPVELQQPIAALGGLLDNWKANTYATGGDTDNPPTTDAFKGFALYAGLPESKNRTPEWDDDETIFNEKDDTAYLNSKNLPYTRTANGLYLNQDGKYYPGTIYAQNPEGGMSYYSITPRGGIDYSIRTPNGSAANGNYDLKNLSVKDYNNLVNLGLDLNRFYSNNEEAALYRPDESIKFNNTYNVGNSSVTYDYPYLDYLAPNKYNQEEFEKMLHGEGAGSYHVVDPDKGYDFKVHSDRLRDGGSQTLRFTGTYPEGLENGMIYAFPDTNSADVVKAADSRREIINKALAPYGLTFGKIHDLGGFLDNQDSNSVTGHRYDFGSWLLKINPSLYEKLGTEDEIDPRILQLLEFYKQATDNTGTSEGLPWNEKVKVNVEDANIRGKAFDDLTAADVNSIFGWEASAPVEKPSEGTTSKEVKSAAKVEGPEAEVFDFYNRRHPDAPKSVEQWNALDKKEKAEYIRAYRKTLKDKKEDFDKRLDDYNKQQELKDRVAKYQEQQAKSSVNLDDLKDISYDNLERIAEVINPNYTRKSLQGLSVDDEKKAVENLRNNIVEWAKDNDKGTLESLNKAFSAPKMHNSWDRTYLDDSLNKETRWAPSGYDYDEFKTRTANYNGSLTPGNLAGNYVPDANFDLGEFPDVNALEESLSYRDYTDKVKAAIRKNKDVKWRYKKGAPQEYSNLEFADPNHKLNEEDYNTLRLLARQVERTKTNPNGEYVPLFTKDNDEYISFNPSIEYDKQTYSPEDYFNHLRTDKILGAMHLTPKENNSSELYTLNNKDYYKLSDIEAKTPDWLKYYIEDPQTTTLEDGTIVHKLSYQDPLNFARATGTPEDIEVKPDGTYVVKGSGENDPFPKAASWPYAVAAGLLLGALGYNMFKPADYGNADALLKASEEAGNYRPVAFRPIGDYLPYKPMDIWFEQNRLNANARATDRAIMNSGANQGSKAAALLASGYNNQLASGNLYRQALEYNDALRKQVTDFNRGTNMFNSEGFLKADMANQDAATRAAGYTLEGKKAAYAMRQAVDDAKANAISAGISGLGNLAMAYGQNKWNQDVLGWKLRHNQYPISLMEGYKYDPYTGKPVSASKGGKLKRRHKGLGF